MAGRLGKRVVHFANLPIKLLMPSSFTDITEIALKTIPSASKIEIKRVLESLYGFQVAKVETLNMEGKKKKRGGLVLSKPDYKKAYVTLNSPLSISPDLFPIRMIQEEKRAVNKQSKTSIVEEAERKKTHWLHSGVHDRFNSEKNPPRRGLRHGIGHDGSSRGSRETARFPWSSMKPSPTW
ncbi:hypothetical protein Dimus_013253 [Dionaea muscipula]